MEININLKFETFPCLNYFFLWVGGFLYNITNTWPIIVGTVEAFLAGNLTDLHDGSFEVTKVRLICYLFFLVLHAICLHYSRRILCDPRGGIL